MLKLLFCNTYMRRVSTEEASVLLEKTELFRNNYSQFPLLNSAVFYRNLVHFLYEILWQIPVRLSRRRIARTRQPGQDSQGRRTVRAGQLEQDRQNRTTSTEQPEQTSHTMTARTSKPYHDSQNITARMDSQDRTPQQDRQNDSQNKT
jgi:hypothetical protein